MKEGCRVVDVQTPNNYSAVDLSGMIARIPFRSQIDVSVTRMSHDEVLPFGFLETLAELGSDLDKWIVGKRRERWPICETVEFTYEFNAKSKLVRVEGESGLHPAKYSGGLVSPDSFDEFNGPKRKPRSWSVTVKQDILRAMKGLHGYDEVLVGALGDRELCWQNVQGLDFGVVVDRVLPGLVDKLYEFVKN